MGPMTADEPLEPATDAAPDGAVRFRTVPTMASYLRLNVAVVRRSRPAQLVGGFIFGTGLVTVMDGVIFGAVSLVLGLLFATGYFVVPFLWFAVRRRRDLLLAPVDITADATGLICAMPMSTTTNAWSVYRRVRETSDAFLLGIGTGSSGFVLKQGVDPAVLDRFRAVLMGAGFDLRPSRRVRRLSIAVVLFLAGMLIAPGFAYGPRAIATIGANATISLSVGAAGGTVTLSGTTDLPDGSQLDLQLVHIDKWNASQTTGASADPADSPWVLYATTTVRGGAFSEPFEVPAWPSGRLVGVADFWMYGSQPLAAVDRYGEYGDKMHGPDVIASSDGSRYLEIQAATQLP